MFKTLEDVAKARQEATKQAERAVVAGISDAELVAVIANAVDDPDAVPKYAWELKPLVLELIARFRKGAAHV